MFETKIGDNSNKKTAFLLKHNIALYDVIYSCAIKGSSDASIKDVTPTDLNKILEKTKIKYIVLNGSKATKLYTKYQKNDCKVFTMPSTSLANARYRLNNLIEKWKIIKDLAQIL